MNVETYESGGRGHGAIESVFSKMDVIPVHRPAPEGSLPGHICAGQGGCHVSAIEMWSANMLGLDPGLLKAVALRDGHQGLVVVDDRRDCTNNTGDVAQTGLSEIKLRKWARFWTDSEGLQEAV